MPATQIRQEPSSGTITQSTPQTIDTSTSTTSGHVDNIANPEGVVMYYVTEGAQVSNHVENVAILRNRNHEIFAKKETLPNIHIVNQVGMEPSMGK